MPQLIQFSDLARQKIQKDDYAVFGGTFDPIHAGHLTVVCALAQRFNKVLLAPTIANPWKSSPTPIVPRREMIRLVLSADSSLANEQSKLEVIDFDYSYTEELVSHLKAIRTGEIYWAVGADSSETVSKWKNFEKLPITIVVMPIEIDTHSTEVRDGGTDIHPALKEFARANSLYGQRK